MFLLTFENLVPTAPTHHYVPRVFGFKIHASSACIPADDHRPPDVAVGAAGTTATTPSQPVATTSAGASSKRPRPVASDTTTTLPAVLGAGEMCGVGGVNSTGHQTLTPLPQSIAHQSSMTASNSNLLGLQSGSERFLAPTHHSHGHLGPGSGGVNGGEKTDKSTSKDYFDEDEDDQDNGGGGQQASSTNHSHNNSSNSQSRTHHSHSHHGSSVIVGGYVMEDHHGASEAIVMEYIDRDEELSRKRRRKEDKHATINEDVEVLMSFDDTTAATAVVSTYPVSLDTGASVTATTHSTGKGRG